MEEKVMEILGGNIGHNTVLLILGEHGSRVGEVHDVVVECLDEVIVAVPPRDLVQIKVGVGAVKVDDIFKIGE